MKKYFKSYIFFALMAFALAGCKMDDLRDDVNDLNDRVTLLEEQVKILNENLEVMAYILNPENRTIQSVKVEGGKYNITLSNGDELVLNIGSEGEVFEPTVTISEDGFWVINGEQTTVKAQGEAGNNLVPEFRIEGGKWQVRYGNEGDWQTVQGEYNIDNVGDQFFESATVDGDMFVIMARDGETIYKLPIVKGLSCVINQTGETEGYIVFASGERKEINVKIEADNVSAPVYPQGWRAELAPKAETGADGFNYVLTVYAPSAKTLSSRASANNGEDIVIRVNKGAFWAVDKIKVKVEKSEPEVKLSDYDYYVAGNSIDIAGLSVNKSTYGDPTEVTSDMNITNGGVYFVAENDVTLTLGTDVTVLGDVVILPKSDDIKNLVVTFANKTSISGDFICKRVSINRTNDIDMFELKSDEVDFALDGCKVNDDCCNKAWLTPKDAKLSSFNVCNTDIKLNKGGQATGFLNNLNCGNFVFINNIVYYSSEVTSESTENQHLNNFKLFSGNNYIVKNIKVSSNTFVDVETTYNNGVTGMIYATSCESIEFNNNIYYMAYPLTEFASQNKTQTTTILLRISNYSDVTRTIANNNYGYNGNSNMKFQLCYGKTATVNMSEIQLVDNLFETFDKANGIFIPNSDYTSYGAQR